MLLQQQEDLDVECCCSLTFVCSLRGVLREIWVFQATGTLPLLWRCRCCVVHRDLLRTLVELTNVLHGIECHGICMPTCKLQVQFELSKVALSVAHEGDL